MAEKFDKEDIAMIATLKAEVEQLKKDREADVKVIQGLLKWKEGCNKAALIWGGFCAAGMSMVAFIFSNFEKIKYILTVRQ